MTKYFIVVKDDCCNFCGMPNHFSGTASDEYVLFHFFLFQTKSVIKVAGAHKDHGRPLPLFHPNLVHSLRILPCRPNIKHRTHIANSQNYSGDYYSFLLLIIEWHLVMVLRTQGMSHY